MNTTSVALRWRLVGGLPLLLRATFCLLGGSLLLAGGYSSATEDLEFRTNGATTSASVIDKNQSAKFRFDADYAYKAKNLYYRYQDDQGQLHDGREPVGATAWEHFRETRVMKIEYLRNQPDKSRMVASSPFFGLGFGSLIMLALGTLGVGAALAFSVGRWIWAGRKVHLVRYGMPFLGVVTGHEQDDVPLSRRRKAYRLCFTFTDATGTKRNGKSSLLPSGLERRWPPSEHILVLQDQGNLSRFEADIFEARAGELAAKREAKVQREEARREPERQKAREEAKADPGRRKRQLVYAEAWQMQNQAADEADAKFGVDTSGRRRVNPDEARRRSEVAKDRQALEDSIAEKYLTKLAADRAISLDEIRAILDEGDREKWERPAARWATRRLPPVGW